VSSDLYICLAHRSFQIEGSFLEPVSCC